ncbi:Ulp1 peptidase [Bertholletia excelsa]
MHLYIMIALEGLIQDMPNGFTELFLNIWEFGFTELFLDIWESPILPRLVNMLCPTTPQQVNGYDCGLYDVAIAKAICSWHESGGPKDDDLWFSVVNEQVSPPVVEQMRGST